MKKIASLLIIATLIATSVSAQKNHIYESPDALFNKGVELFNQNHHGASTKYLRLYLDSPFSKENAQYRREASYYIACNAYALKDRKTLDLLEEHLAQYPTDPMIDRIEYMIGRLYYEKKQYAEAIKHFEKINNSTLTDVESEEYLFAQANSHLMLKEYDKASAIFSTLSAPGKIYAAESAYYHAYSEFCMKNYENAIEIFAEIPEESDYYESGQYFTLQIYDQSKMLTKAVEFGEELIKKFPSSQYNSEAYRILGENSYNKSNWEDATKYLQMHIKINGKAQRSAFYMWGISLYKTEQYHDAVKALGKVTTQEDTLAQNAYLFIGHAHLKQNEPDKARVAFQSASLIEADKQLQEEALYNQALATYECRPHFGEMIKTFERFLTDYPNSKYKDNINEHIADIYLTDKDYQNALASISKIENLTPKLKLAKENALFQIGLKAYRAKQFKNAIELFTQSINEMTPESQSAQAYLWRGEAKYRLGNASGAREDINTFLSQKQGKTADQLQKAYYTLAYTYIENEQYNLAKPYLNKFFEISGKSNSRYHNDALNRLGDCYFNNRDFDNARATYSQVPSSSPFADYAQYQNAFIAGLQKQYDQKIDELNTLVKRYPNSDYNDDAMYEIGRTYVLQEKNQQAITAYKALQKAQPQSQLSRKAALEIGMLYANLGNTDEAINSYKYVINNYPTSQETRVALESMQSLYVDENRVDEYLEYRESIAGTTISSVAKGEEDSLSFIAAEQVYARGEYQQAIPSLTNYIKRYCETLTQNCITAQYYLAESHYLSGNKESALEYYDKLSTLDGNIHLEPSLLRASEISYDNQDYTSALNYFTHLRAVASNPENRASAQLGILRCSFYTGQHESGIDIASEIINDANSEPQIVSEAKYNRAKAYIALRREQEANPDLIDLSADASQANGAEANYLLAQNYFDAGNLDEAENIIIKFSGQGTPHQYWLARTFILLSDIYKQRNDIFMAKQYLLSLQENYTEQNEIQEMIAQRLGLLQELEADEVLE